jgi:hypothetical protein
MAIVSQLRSATWLVLGGVQHVTQGRTPDAAHQSLINLFCRTGGRSSDRLSQLIALANPPYKLPDARGVAGDLDAPALKSITDDLDARGYHVFEKRLPNDLCESLLRFASTNPCSVRASSGTVGSSKPLVVNAYDPAKSLGHRYDFSSHDIINNADVQRLMGDHSLVAVAQSYLRSKPVLDVMGMWWHTAFGDGPDAEAAQFYHFDMDRIKWLKFFIYLTDVGPENGPHCFIEGSHRAGGIPPSILEKGYSRLTDEEVSSSYSADRIVEFTAPRGTIIAEDTRGLHKGKHVAKGDRLMLQLQFSNSLFGGYYPPSRIARVVAPDLAEMVDRFPRIYANYLE